MANRYDSAGARPEQTKVFKFYCPTLNKILIAIAQNEQQARDILTANKLIFVARLGGAL